MALLDDDNAIEAITANKQAHYEPMGWHHWPEHPWLSYQFRRGLGETQEGGGAVSEVFLAASRMIPGDLESWHAEWKRIGEEEYGFKHVESGPLVRSSYHAKEQAREVEAGGPGAIQSVLEADIPAPAEVRLDLVQLELGRPGKTAPEGR